jgi:small GTP-binding protein
VKISGRYRSVELVKHFIEFFETLLLHSSMNRRMRPSLPNSRDTYLVRLLMCGDSSAGKTSLVLRFTSNEFSHNFASTIGVDFRTHKTLFNGRDCTIQVWDTAGQERYNALTSSFFNRADGVCLAFDCASRDSFERIKHWWAELTSQKDVGTEVNAVIAATKTDLLAKSRAVSEEEGRSLAASYGVPFFETSSKEGTGVKETFSALTKLVIDRKYPHSVTVAEKAASWFQSEAAPLEMPPWMTAAQGPIALGKGAQQPPVAGGSTGPCC